LIIENFKIKKTPLFNVRIPIL